MPRDSCFISLLVDKILYEPVMFFVGAGLSKNWGFPLGQELARWIAERYKSMNQPREPEVQAVLEKEENRGSLPLVAEVLARNKCWFVRNVLWCPESPPCLHFYSTEDELGDGDPLEEGRFGVPHIVIGRLAKEGLIQEIMTTNYDCLLEAGCYAVGMFSLQGDQGSQSVSTAFPWTEAYRVFADCDDALRLAPRRAVFRIYKIHGCIAALKRRVQQTPCSGPCAHHTRPPGNGGFPCNLSQEQFNLVITYRELLDWRHDHWARDLFLDRVRTHHVVFLGTDVSDSVLHASLRSVFEEAWGRAKTAGDNRPSGKLSVTGTGAGTSSYPGDAISKAQVAAGQETSEPTPPANNLNCRAQATEREVSPILRQILRTAAQDHLIEDAQVYSLGQASRERLGHLFRQVYSGVMRGLIVQQLNLQGTGWIEGLLARSESDLELSGATVGAVPSHSPGARIGLLRRSREVCERIISRIESLPDKFWYDALPVAVLISWLLGEPALSEGDSSLLRRVSRRYYYVPPSYVKELTFPLLLAYAALVARTVGDGAKCLHGGWVLLRPQERVQPLVFPVVLPPDHYLTRRLNLPRSEVRPPLWLARQACVQPTLLLVDRIGTGSRRVRVNPAIMPGVGSAFHIALLRYQVVSERDLLDDAMNGAWIEQLYSMRRE